MSHLTKPAKLSLARSLAPVSFPVGGKALKGPLFCSDESAAVRHAQSLIILDDLRCAATLLPTAQHSELQRLECSEGSVPKFVISLLRANCMNLLLRRQQQQQPSTTVVASEH